jgi:hypothetical protein
MGTFIRWGRGRVALPALLGILVTWSVCAVGSEGDASHSRAAPYASIQIDVRAWIDAFRRADDGGQDALLKQWVAHHRSCARLLQRCRPEDKAAATEVLAGLWRRNRLSPDDRAAIVRDTVSMSIVEREASDAARGHRELAIRAKRQFPFPKGTWLEWDYDIAVGIRPLRLAKTGGNSRDWEGVAPLDIGSFGGMGYFGTPSARALVELREVVRGKVIWRETWAVGPTSLSRIQPPGR